MVSQMISQVPSNKKIPQFWEPARSTHVNTAAMSVSTNQTPPVCWVRTEQEQAKQTWWFPEQEELMALLLLLLSVSL